MRRNKDIDYRLEDNKLVLDVIERCDGLPLAIAIIAGLNLKNDEDWKDVMKMIVAPESEFKTNEYHENLYRTIELSINTLSQKHAELFRSLRVFKAAKMSLESVAALWQVQLLEAKATLQHLHSKSLLTFVDAKR